MDNNSPNRDYLGCMSVSPNEFRDYLAPDEAVVSSARGTIVDDSFRSPGTIGITERRVLVVTDAEQFLEVSHDAITSIRSRPKSTFTARGIGFRLVVVVGALIAIAGFVGVLAVQSSAQAFLFALATLGGAVTAEYVRRAGSAGDWPAPDEVWGALTTDRVSLVDVMADAGLGRSDGSEIGNEYSPVFVLVLGAVSLVSLFGLVGVTGRLVVVPLVVVALAGLALSDYAYRRTKTLDATGEGRRRERALSIHLVDGRTVTFRVDSSERIDSALSGVVREPVAERALTELRG